jgi:hypothetical protein
MIINSRRAFAKAMGLAGAGMGSFLTKEAGAQTITPSPANDIAILQFALNLEYLEAEFYSYATTGQSISAAGVKITGGGTAGGTTGGQQVSFFNNSTLALSIAQIAADERAHVTLLQTTLTSLGATPIAKPAINLNALGTGLQSQEAFLALARAFESVGMSAYAGAAPLISSSTILGYAARILATEAQHVGNLNLHCALYQAPTTAVDGADSLPPPSGSRFILTNSLGLPPVRTPGQVLNLVYGGVSGASMGGFFPNGVNGTLTTSTAADTNNNT